MLSQFKEFNKFRRNPLEYIHALAEDGADQFLIKIPGTRIHILFDADAANRVLVTKSKSYGRCAMVFDRIRPLTGAQGLVQLQGKEWREARHYYAGLFTDVELAKFASRIEMRASVLAEMITRESVQNTNVEISNHIARFVIGNVIDFVGGSDSVNSESIAQDFLELNQLCGRRMLSPVNLPSLRIMRLRKSLASRLSPILSSSRLKFPSKSDRFNLDQIQTFMFAGHETTTSSIVSALYLVAKHPQVQDCFAELSHSEQTNYLMRIYDETLRLYPPAWILARTALSEDPELNVAAGDHIVIAVREIHRREKYWSKAEAFNPERAEFSRPHSGRFIPFGAGPKLCIGKNMAIMEAVALLRQLMNHFRMSSVSELHHQANITLYPKGATIIKFAPNQMVEKLRMRK